MLFLVLAVALLDRAPRPTGFQIIICQNYFFLFKI